MAVTDFNAEEKFRAYHTLACLNRSFRFIVANLYELDKTGVFNPKSLSTFRGLAKELQSQLNYKLLSTLLAIEGKDAFKFGKVRIEREHYLNPDRPAFRKPRK